MLSRNRLATDVRQLLERQHLEPTSEGAKDGLERSSEIDKREKLKAFLDQLIIDSEGDEWVERLRDML